MNGWDFLKCVLEEHPAFFYTAAVSLGLVVFHFAIYGAKVTVVRNVVPLSLEWPAKSSKDKP